MKNKNFHKHCWHSFDFRNNVPYGRFCCFENTIEHAPPTNREGTEQKDGWVRVKHSRMFWRSLVEGYRK